MASSVGNPTYYIQSCPTCARRLQVRVEYLGKSVACQHCSARFTAAETPAAGGAHPLLARAEELLRRAPKASPLRR